MTIENKIYRYPANLQIAFPEGLEEIKFIKEIDGFNYLSIKNSEDSEIKLPEEFEISAMPQEFLDRLKKEEYLKIEDLRKELQFENIIYQNNEFSASQMARQNILGVISILSNSQNNQHFWKDINEVSYQFNLNDFTLMLNIIWARDTKLYYIESQVKNELNKILNSPSFTAINIKNLWQSCEESYEKL